MGATWVAGGMESRNCWVIYVYLAVEEWDIVYVNIKLLRE